MSTDAARDKALRAGILITGSEILGATITDANGPWLIRDLNGRGVEVSAQLSVGDRQTEILAALDYLANTGCELIITSGGLGPTADDLTVAAVAEWAGRETHVDPELESHIRGLVSRAGPSVNPVSEQARLAGARKQAIVPVGATVLEPAGTAPGLVVSPITSGDHPIVVVLPGPPSELEVVWKRALDTEEIAALLRDVAPAYVARLRLFEVSESQIAEFLRECESEGLLEGLEVVTCLRDGDLEVDLHAIRPGDTRTVEKLADRVADTYGRKLFSRNGDSILEVVSRKLADHRLAVAESCTGGMLASRITDYPGASGHLLGGAVTYANEIKRDLIDVDEALISEYGAASPQVARAMCEGTLRRFRADLAVSTTGIAGPGGGTPQKPVGYVCICAMSASGLVVEREVVLGRERNEVRRRTVTLALHLLDELLDRLAGVPFDG